MLSVLGARDWRKDFTDLLNISMPPAAMLGVGNATP